MLFEETTSPLYYSNDGCLRVETIAHPDDVHGDGTPIALPRRVHAVTFDGRQVFATLDRVKADAYIAGYDFALAHATSDAMQQ